MGLPLAGEANQSVILLPAASNIIGSASFGMSQLDRVERVAQVAPQVVDVFDAHR